MKKTRVLVVDDSVIIRRLLSSILAEDPTIEVVGVAANGRIALQKMDHLQPDLVTLDVSMPDMDGLETLTEIRKTKPALPVIMFSTLTERGAEETLEALARGASDYVAKPANVDNVEAGMDSVRKQLLPKIKALCSVRTPLMATPRRTPVNTGALGGSPAGLQRCDLVVIGSSTGGPQALSAVLRQLPKSFPVPIAVVQHMPPVFTKHLAARLNQECELEVFEAQGGETLRGGTVAIAPGDYHMMLEGTPFAIRTKLGQGPPENSCRPAVDVLFRSCTEAVGGNVLAVVLTGMGRDGALGAEHIRDAGGAVIAQDEATSVVWGMPRAVVEAGLATATLPLSEVPGEIVKFSLIRGKKPVNS
ncbi:MAG: chemotaxis response regulator protein-glutamate methylesterase [Planctomycetales bacterium]|nr:chemotaxis response regulator protein-glutamate methylesterase [Planctomycetales bacterium]